ncbi:MAG: hypothetical protein ACOYOF_05115 [Verrucomicrobiaceae bacterium]
MIVDEIIELSEARPFTPFEVRLADGASVMVKHPKWMMFMPDFQTLIVVGSQPGQRRIAVPLITQVIEHPEQDMADISAALHG